MDFAERVEYLSRWQRESLDHWEKVLKGYSLEQRQHMAHCAAIFLLENLADQDRPQTKVGCSLSLVILNLVNAVQIAHHLMPVQFAELLAKKDIDAAPLFYDGAEQGEPDLGVFAAVLPPAQFTAYRTMNSGSYIVEHYEACVREQKDKGLPEISLDTLYYFQIVLNNQGPMKSDVIQVIKAVASIPDYHDMAQVKAHTAIQYPKLVPLLDAEGEAAWGKHQKKLLLAQAQLKHACPACGKAGTKRCSRCKLVFYCSAECQRIHWTVHKKECSEK